MSISYFRITDGTIGALCTHDTPGERVKEESSEHVMRTFVDDGLRDLLNASVVHVDRPNEPAVAYPTDVISS